MKDYPLGLPQGSVRAILALSMIIFAFWYFYLFQNIPKELVGIITFVITYYFTKRDGYVKKLGHWKLRYKINEQAKLREVIMTGLTPGDCIEKLRQSLDKEYLDLMVEEIIRLD